MSYNVVNFENAYLEHEFSGQHTNHVRPAGYAGHIEDKDLNTPPGAPSHEDTYIVAAGGVGVWAGHDDDLATWQEGRQRWMFVAPEEGNFVWVRDELLHYVYTAGAWTPYNPSPWTGDVDANCHRLLRPKSIGNTDGKAILFSNCYPKLSNALADLPAAGGTIILVPGFDEDIDGALVIPCDHMSIISPNCDAKINDVSGAGLTAGMIQFNGKSDLHLYGIELNGQAPTFNTWGMVPTTSLSYRVFIERCLVRACSRGITGSASAHLNQSAILRCRFGSNTQAAIYAQYMEQMHILDCYSYEDYRFLTALTDANQLVVEVCRVENPTDCGMYLNSQWEPIIVKACEVYRSDGAGFYTHGNTTGPHGPIYKGCIARYNDGHGFLFIGDVSNKARGTCESCESIDNSYGVPNSGSGFKLFHDSERVRLINCVGIKQVRAEQKYGVEIDLAAEKCQVIGGVYSPNQTGPWLDNNVPGINIIDAPNN